MASCSTVSNVEQIVARLDVVAVGGIAIAIGAWAVWEIAQFVMYAWRSHIATKRWDEGKGGRDEPGN